ncbi:MAG: hypothetical protein V7629_01215 [Motiliproteus sp.]
MLTKKLYSDELVELANQAWILNVALAELHRFDARITAHLLAEPVTALQLAHDRDDTLSPAISRLKIRLDALLSKWQRRIVQESPELVSLVISAEPWGCRLEVPDAIRKQIQIESAGDMPLADAEMLAAGNPEVFYIFWTQSNSAEDPFERVSVTGFSGIELNTAKMWWSWCLDSPWPLSRLQVTRANLWQVDRCY